MTASASRYRFGLYEFDLDSQELSREGSPVPLQNQPAQLLALLIRNAGTIVTKQAMIEHIWGEKTHVDYNEGLSYAVKQIRKALRDDSENPCFLQNVPRRGYRFIAPLESVSASPELPLVRGKGTHLGPQRGLVRSRAPGHSASLLHLRGLPALLSLLTVHYAAPGRQVSSPKRSLGGGGAEPVACLK